jgi:hypothetical protein
MKFTSVVLALIVFCGTLFATENATHSRAGASLDDNELLLPANYGSWVALSPTAPGIPTHRHKHLVSKVYVEPTAYDVFMKKGVWPNHTMIVLELRDKVTQPKTLCDGLIGLEVAAKDDARTPDPWSYYGIIYDHKDSSEHTATTNSSEEPVDTRLAAYYPALRAVIHAKPWMITPTIF